MKNCIFLTLLYFNSKMIFKIFFNFLKKEGFYLTTDEKLIIPEWKKNGIAYTNDIHVIIFVDNIQEKRFETIIYKIQDDYKIPIYSKNDYFSLEDFLKIKNINYSSDYNSISGLLKILNLTKLIMKSNLDIFNNIPPLPHEQCH